MSLNLSNPAPFFISRYMRMAWCGHNVCCWMKAALEMTKCANYVNVYLLFTVDSLCTKHSVNYRVRLIILCSSLCGSYASRPLHCDATCCFSSNEWHSEVTRRDGRMSRASVSHFGRLGGFGPHGLEPWSSQTNDLIVYTCRFLARHLT